MLAGATTRGETILTETLTDWWPMATYVLICAAAVVASYIVGD